MMNVCPHCGGAFDGTSCPYCGTAVSAAPPEAPPSPPPGYTDPGGPPPPSGYWPYPPVAPPQAVRRLSPKSRATTLLLCILVGVLGVHHFYAGNTAMGLLYLFTGGLCGIGWIVDIIRIACGSYRDAYGMYIVND